MTAYTYFRTRFLAFCVLRGRTANFELIPDMIRAADGMRTNNFHI